jgi:hypothetical protein
VLCGGRGLRRSDGEARTISDPGPDCDDTNAAINPGATELPGDGVDQDCDTDELCYADADNDGARTTRPSVSADARLRRRRTRR